MNTEHKKAIKQQIDDFFTPEIIEMSDRIKQLSNRPFSLEDSSLDLLETPEERQIHREIVQRVVEYVKDKEHKREISTKIFNRFLGLNDTAL